MAQEVYILIYSTNSLIKLRTIGNTVGNKGGVDEEEENIRHE